MVLQTIAYHSIFYRDGDGRVIMYIPPWNSKKSQRINENRMKLVLPPWIKFQVFISSYFCQWAGLNLRNMFALTPDWIYELSVSFTLGIQAGYLQRAM